MTDRDAILDVSRRMAAAIGRRDPRAIQALLARDFVQRSIGRDAAATADEFLAAIAQIPGEILSIDLSDLQVDLADEHAIVIGIQHARVRIDGEVVDDKRAFVDWMVKEAGEWRFRAAIDFPG